MDLYGESQEAISSGNARFKQSEEYNNTVGSQKDAILKSLQDKTQGAVAQVSQQSQSTKVADGIGALGGGAKLKGSVTEATKFIQDTRPTGVKIRAQVGFKQQPNLPSDPAAEERASLSAELPFHTPEGSGAEGTTTMEASHDLTTGGSEAGSLWSRGLKGLNMSDEGLAKLKVVGKVGGIAGGVAAGGMDIYKDFKGDGWSKESGLDRTADIFQIGGAVADMVGIAFPPAAVVGAAADLIGGAIGEIGSFFDDKQKTASIVKKAVPDFSGITTGAAIQTGGELVGRAE
tara:strand:- start:3966 stop:4832 length:867 start_codon:yes stop_codon:yes gene_type:complete